MKQGSQPVYKIKAEKNVYVTMRDGVRLAIDIYRPDAEGKFPSLLRMTPYGKDLQVLPQVTQVKAAGALLWDGVIDSGDTNYIVPRGYVHVIGDVRGSGDSEGEHIGKADPNDIRDGYEVVEWIARQPWCDGNVGTIAMENVAAEQPPHLKAMLSTYFASQDPSGVLGSENYRIFSGRPMDPGPNNGSGVAARNFVSALVKNLPKEEFEKLQQERLKDPDLRQYSIYWSVARYPFKNPYFADQLLDPDGKFLKPKPLQLDKIKAPVFIVGPLAGGWPEGAFALYNGVNVPKKVLMVPPGTVDRPWRSQHEEAIRWFDHWLKGIDTGYMEESPIKIFVTGANQYRYEQEWPLARTRWTKLYLRTWNRLLEEEPDSDDREPDCFVQEPLARTTEVKSVKYVTSPFLKDTTIIGPMAIYFYAAIDQDDTNWNVKVRELDERGRPIELSPPQYPDLTDSWLKASYKALNESRTKPWSPWHLGTREPVLPGKVYEYAIGLGAISNVFKAGHRLELQICSMDTVPGFMHICSGKTVVHKIFHSKQYQSHLLLPVIPPD